MKNQFVAAGFVVFSFMLPLKANAAAFSQMYTFGDSLVDNHNVFQYTDGALPPSQLGYYNGRFTNGPVWVDYLADDLGIQQTNYAFGGATTGTYNTIELPPKFGTLPGLTAQVQSFMADYPQADENGLYVIWAGANDYLGGGVKNPLQPVNNLVSTVDSLASIGAKNFLVVNLPDLGNTPTTYGTPYSGGLNYLTGLHNSALSETLTALNQQQPNLKITLLDSNSLFNRVIGSPGEFGFTNVTDSCLNLTAKTICSNPDEYLMWDYIHPTTSAHRIIAGAAVTAIPEPSSVLGMLGFGALGATGILKRKQKKVTVGASKSSS
jgi:phospholipase/lecithinase/hemolysin